MKNRMALLLLLNLCLGIGFSIEAQEKNETVEEKEGIILSAKARIEEDGARYGGALQNTTDKYVYIDGRSYVLVDFQYDEEKDGKVEEKNRNKKARLARCFLKPNSKLEMSGALEKLVRNTSSKTYKAINELKGELEPIISLGDNRSLPQEEGGVLIEEESNTIFENPSWEMSAKLESEVPKEGYEGFLLYYVKIFLKNKGEYSGTPFTDGKLSVRLFFEGQAYDVSKSVSLVKSEDLASYKLYFGGVGGSQLYAAVSNYKPTVFIKSIDPKIEFQGPQLPEGNFQVPAEIESSELTLTVERNAFATEMMVSQNEDFEGGSWETAREKYIWTVADEEDGEKKVYVKFRNDAGRESKALSKTFVVHRKPEGEILSPETTETLKVVLGIEAKYAHEMILSEKPDFSDAAWQEYSPQASIQLEDVDGLKTIHIKFRNKKQVESAVYTTQTRLVRQPVGTFSIADTLNASPAIVQIDSFLLADLMMGSTNPSFSGADWVRIDSSLQIPLGDVDGEMILYVKFKNLKYSRESQVIQKNIFLDRKAPSKYQLIINGGVMPVKSQQLKISLTALDEDVSAYALAFDTLRKKAWQPIEMGQTVLSVLSSDFLLSGEKRLYLYLKDQAENISTPFALSFIFENPSINLGAGADPSEVEASEYKLVSSANSISAFSDFIQKYPISSFRNDAQTRLKDLEVKEVESQPTVDGYQYLLAKYAIDTALVAKGLKEIDRLSFESAEEAKSIDAFKVYLEEFAEGAYRDKAVLGIATLAYNQAVKQNSDEALWAYLEEYPKSPWVGIVKGALESRAFLILQENPVPKAVKAFLSKFPDGQYKDEARFFLLADEYRQSLHQPKAKTFEALLDSAPAETHWEPIITHQQERLRFDQISQQEEESAYREFMKLHPNSDFKYSAQAFLERVDFETAYKTNNSASYQSFDRKYPNSCWSRYMKETPEGHVFVLGGAYQMGCAEGNCLSASQPAHMVKLQGFYMQDKEVTINSFLEFAQAQEYFSDAEQFDGSFVYDTKEAGYEKNTYWIHDERGGKLKEEEYQKAVAHVSWDDALAYAKWKSVIDRTSYRLPTEAEWEFAARGGVRASSTLYAGGQSPDEVAWYYGNSGKKPLVEYDWKEVYKKKCSTQAVGLLKPNELGLYDMTGNVWELCADWYAPYEASEATVKNPVQLDNQGNGLVARGGSWHSSLDSLSVTARRAIGRSSETWADVGFRLVRDIPLNKETQQYQAVLEVGTIQGFEEYIKKTPNTYWAFHAQQSIEAGKRWKEVAEQAIRAHDWEGARQAIQIGLFFVKKEPSLIDMKLKIEKARVDYIKQLKIQTSSMVLLNAVKS